ncbi:hypothetical protein [Gayadomonas joobiniege]|uniref:hypothetical protein n=1 Tax=Gayadomonas joobiniege TaxID=1234606 RepID=UPI00037EB701|nr:hypothetical protein [Gayadomonas joobiniege]
MAGNDLSKQILCGPILRHLNNSEVTFWLVTRQAYQFSVYFLLPTGRFTEQPVKTEQVQIGERAYVYLLQVQPQNELPSQQKIEYQIQLTDGGENYNLADGLGDIYYPGEKNLSFYVPHNIRRLAHGSCRKPHHPSDDALACLDQSIANGEQARPDLLVLSGDQVYLDDVCGPMVHAISQVIEQLGLYHETLPGSRITNSQALAELPESYYQRVQLLPHTEANQDLYKRFFQAKRKPVFTSVHAQNHLISLNEMLAMYLLVWSPSLWQAIHWSHPDVLLPEFKSVYDNEKQILQAFTRGLAGVRRLFAHIPVYMIFDDHDVTDDWNLTRNWEESAYGNPYSKRIIGNALSAYWLCQGWGNTPARFKPMLEPARKAFGPEQGNAQDKFIEQLFAFEGWHYQLDTKPYLMVLDTRTRRWRSESNGNKPSGLMDWEALCDMQQKMLGHDSVILISAAPVFGNKMIEAVQKIFTFFGQALVVDAENWMAHRGTANVLMNIFRHLNTPGHFIILSGDVHYSFVYDVSLRHKQNANKIIQFTCSGFKNEFPARLLKCFDKLDQIFFSENSPLNIFTKRRHLKIASRHPADYPKQSVFNGSGVGLLELDKNGQATRCQIFTIRGKCIDFIE